jgi:hypothetical protein
MPPTKQHYASSLERTGRREPFQGNLKGQYPVR